MTEVALLERAKELNSNEEYAEALQVLNQISTQCADDPYYWVRRGIALYHLHREDEAVPCFVRAQEGALSKSTRCRVPFCPKV